jgi:hypothetical protein
MVSDADALVAELTEHYEALGERPLPFVIPRGTTWERFHRFLEHYSRFFELAIAAGLAVEHATDAPTAELDMLGRSVLRDGAYQLDALWGGLDDGLSDIGTEFGYFYGGQPWDELCLVRSAITFLEELSQYRGPPLGQEARDRMDTWAYEMYVPVEAPAGMPRRHWWWFGPYGPE